MKLNPDCVRAVMLAVENKPLNETLNVDSLHDLLLGFDEDEITYCCLKLEEGGFLNLLTVEMMGQHYPGIKYVYDLTYAGHQFLEKIRDDSIWRQTKEKAKGAGSFALDVLAQIAGSIIAKSLGF